MRKSLKYISKASAAQIQFAARLGLDVAGDTVGVALAKIHDAIDKDFLGCDLGEPTAKQVELARKFGWDIDGSTRRVGNAVLNDLMTQLNLESIKSQRLKPGCRAVMVYDSFQKILTVSSIKPDGTVYFKGEGCIRAWARNVRRVKEKGG